MKSYNIYDQSKEKHFQYFAERFTYLAFQIFEDNSKNNLHDIILDYHMIMEKCESPIEKIMGSILLFMTDGYSDLCYQEAVGEGESRDFGAFFSCQQYILDKYRIDFLVRLYVNQAHIDIAIECDGHDFHEKTKQQASRDKKRDRDFAKENIIVLRFSGSDIFSRTKECIEEISDFLYSKKESLIKLAMSK